MTDSPRTFAILGHPLGHTMSPPIHTRLFQLSGFPRSRYEVMDIAPELLESAVPSLKALDGFNITIPHKVDIIPYLDELDDSARRYQSVNVVRKQNGKYRGYNTDVDGFLRTVQSAGASLDGTVCLIGAGGVGRMFAIESVLQGAALTIAVLPHNRYAAQELREQILAMRPDARIQVMDSADLRGNFDLMINATPVGMYPKWSASPVREEALDNVKVLFDCIYNPTETLLMKTAAAHGVKTVGGMAMLVWQAVSAHEIWDAVSFGTGAIQALIDEMVQTVDARFPLPIPGTEEH